MAPRQGAGLGPAEFDKSVVRSGGLKSLEIMRDAGLPMAFGSDLLGGLRKYHCMEFELLTKVLTPAEIIRSATVVGADLCQMTGQIGTIAAGAFADLIVVDGDSLADIALLQEDGAQMPLIKAGGRSGCEWISPAPDGLELIESCTTRLRRTNISSCCKRIEVGVKQHLTLHGHMLNSGDGSLEMQYICAGPIEIYPRAQRTDQFVPPTAMTWPTCPSHLL